MMDFFIYGFFAVIGGYSAMVLIALILAMLD